MRTTLRLLLILAAAALVVPASALASVTHTVRRGETLSSIAATDGLSVSALAAANGMGPGSVLASGSQVVIPPRGSAAAGQPVATSQPSVPAEAPQATAPVGANSVRVAPGETLSALAARYGTTVAALAADNGMRPDGLLLAGRTLTVPGASGAGSAPTRAAVSDGASGAGATPVAASVSPSEVGAIASQNDVSPALAEAIADQESGFNDAEVSRTGATGVMQIEPSTWRQLTGPGGLTLSSDSATDNVRGGVALLHDLLGQTGGDESEAIAGYYQGLNSVRARGMYPSTQRYVANVLALQGRYGG